MATKLTNAATPAAPPLDPAWSGAPCILFALRRESMILRRQSERLAKLRQAPCPAEFRRLGDTIVLMAETGMGAHAASRFLDWLANAPTMGAWPYRPLFTLSAGFCGALDRTLQVGELVVAAEVSDGCGNLWHCTLPMGTVPDLLSAGIRCGRLVSLNDMVSEPAAKLALGQRHGALAVDMETASVARWCNQHGILFGAVRAVSDELQRGLPAALARVLHDGRVSPPRLAAALLRRPALLRDLYRLAQDTRVGAHRLAAALAGLLNRSEPLPFSGAIRI